MAFGTYDQGSSDRGLSTKLWLGCNPDVIRNDPRHGVFFLEDLNTLNGSGNYTLTQATAGTFALDTSVDDGVGLLDCASSTVTQGGNLQWQGPLVIPEAGKKVAFEVRLKGVDIGTGPEFFAGLSDIDTAIIAGSAMASNEMAGFYSVTDDNVLLFATEDTGTATAASASPHTLVEDTYVKLGFVIDGVSDVDIYVDGVKAANTNTFDIPEGVPLAPSFVCQSNGTTDPIIHIDWFAVGVF